MRRGLVLLEGSGDRTAQMTTGGLVVYGRSELDQFLRNDEEVGIPCELLRARNYAGSTRPAHESA